MSFIEKAQLSYLKYRHKISPILFLVSFVIDLYFIKNPDSLETIIFISTHFLLTIIFIILSAIAANKDMSVNEKSKWSASNKIFLEIFIQFTFGALASALFVLYFKGSDFIASLPFLFLLAGFLIGNEFAQKHTSRLEVRYISTIFLAYTFLLYLVPLFTGKLGNISLIQSTVIALIVSLLILWLIKIFAETLYIYTKKVLIFSLVAVFVGIPALIFFDVIPPLPLIMRGGEVVHSITKTEGYNYILTSEKIPAYRMLGIPFLFPSYLIEEGGEIAFFTSVYTPNSISTNINHVWKIYDPDTRTFTERSKIPLRVAGGRENGFRTYSIITNPEAGLWSVSAELNTGQVLGHRKFFIKKGSPILYNIQK
jgi:hypothetical protein